MITICLSIFNSFAFEFHCVIPSFFPFIGHGVIYWTYLELTFIVLFLQNKQQLNKFQSFPLELYAKDSSFEFHMFLLIIYDTMQFKFRVSNFKNFKWTMQYMQILVKTWV